VGQCGLDASGSGWEPVASSCEHGNGPLDLLLSLSQGGFNSSPYLIQYPVDIGSLSPGVKHPAREADHLPPGSTEVKNAWRCTSTPLAVFMACCLVQHRDYFTSKSADTPEVNIPHIHKELLPFVPTLS
jgi:hypothetical protein